MEKEIRVHVMMGREHDNKTTETLAFQFGPDQHARFVMPKSCKKSNETYGLHVPIHTQRKTT